MSGHSLIGASLFDGDPEAADNATRLHRKIHQFVELLLVQVSCIQLHIKLGPHFSA
jgi:hypothetical protein